MKMWKRLSVLLQNIFSLRNNSKKDQELGKKQVSSVQSMTLHWVYYLQNSRCLMFLLMKSIRMIKSPVKMLSFFKNLHKINVNLMNFFPCETITYSKSYSNHNLHVSKAYSSFVQRYIISFMSKQEIKTPISVQSTVNNGANTQIFGYSVAINSPVSVLERAMQELVRTHRKREATLAEFSEFVWEMAMVSPNKSHTNLVWKQFLQFPVQI